METVKSRSESPFSNDKANSQSLENPENKIEQIKQKKKSKRNKQKTELNGNENADSAKNGNDSYEEEVLNPHQIENNGNENDNGIDIQNDNNKESCDVLEGNDSSNSMPVLVEEKPFHVPETTKKSQEEIIIEESTNSEEPIKQAVIENENNFENGNDCNSMFLNETDDCAKKVVSEMEDSAPADGEGINNGIEENNSGEANGVSVSSTQDQENAEGNSFLNDTPESSIDNSNNESWIKEVDTTKDADQAEPEPEHERDPEPELETETPTKEENTFSNKISSFLGKWNTSLSPEQKQDSEITSSKKLNDSFTSKGSILSHPYLSKVSGRPGIRGGFTSSTLSLSSDSKNDDIKTPKSSEITLNDSFRVRTDPSRLNPSEFQENPTLRKFKGKRCLNASDDPIDGDDVFSSTTKKRKIEDKTSDSGFFGNILWSPFRKKSLDGEETAKLPTTESKLSRFLSPFWFWKRTAACQKGQ